MRSFSLWTMNCRRIRESGIEWSSDVGMHFEALLGRKPGPLRTLQQGFTHKFYRGSKISYSFTGDLLQGRCKGFATQLGKSDARIPE